MASTKLIQTATTPAQPQPILWRLAIQQHNKTYLYTLCLSSTDTGVQVIQKVKSMLERVMPLHHWNEIFFFKHLIVETASLTPSSNLHLEEGQNLHRHEVFPVDSQPNLAFTTAFHGPSAFTEAVNFVAENSQFAIGSGGNGRVLLLRYAVDWSGVRIAVAAALVLSIGVG